MSKTGFTQVLQLGQLFTKRVVALLQQPLLLLHTLHVLSQRADLSLMLQQEELTAITALLFSHTSAVSLTSKCVSLFFIVSPDLGDEELAGRQLAAGLLHFTVTLQLHVLELTAALHHGLHLRLDLTDVETCHSELLLDGATDLHRLHEKQTTEQDKKVVAFRAVVILCTLTDKPLTNH